MSTIMKMTAARRRLDAMEHDGYSRAEDIVTVPTMDLLVQEKDEGPPKPFEPLKGDD